MTRHDALPPTLPPLGLSRAEAAAYIGVGATKFDTMVEDGRMPPAKRIDGRRVWYRLALDKAFINLPDEVSNGDTTGGDQANDNDAWGNLQA